MFVLFGIYAVSAKAVDDTNTGIPLVINDDVKVFDKIASDIGTALPRNVQILTYNIFFLNCDTETSSQISENFQAVLSGRQTSKHYTMFFIDDVMKQHPEIDFSFMNKLNDQDLIAFGQNISADVVFISSVTLLEGKYKRVWNPQTHQFVKKKIMLFQGNIFSTKTGVYMLRLSEYFLVN